MKQLKILLLTLVLAMTCGVASAQKGMQGVGVNIGGEFELFGGFAYDMFPAFEVRYQYNASNYYRLEPFFAYGGPVSGHNEIQVGLNNHFFISKVRRFRPYLIAGFGFGQIKRSGEHASGYAYEMYKETGIGRYLDISGCPIGPYDHGGYDYYDAYDNIKSITDQGFFWRSGIGFDYRFTHTLSGQLEVCADGLVSSEGSKGAVQLKFGLMYNF